MALMWKYGQHMEFCRCQRQAGLVVDDKHALGGEKNQVVNSVWTSLLNIKPLKGGSILRMFYIKNVRFFLQTLRCIEKDLQNLSKAQKHPIKPAYRLTLNYR